MEEKEKHIFTMAGFREDFDPDNRVVKQEDVEFNGDTYFISTVDLGLDHNFYGDKPLWYETMIFFRKTNGDLDFHDLYCDRYTTKEEALKGHEEAKEKLLSGKLNLK